MNLSAASRSTASQSVESTKSMGAKLGPNENMDWERRRCEQNTKDTDQLKVLRAQWRGRGDKGGKSNGGVYAWMGGMGNKHITPRWQVDGDWWTRVKHWMKCIVTMRCCEGMKLICLVGVLSPGRKTYDHRTMGLSYSVYWVVVGGKMPKQDGVALNNIESSRRFRLSMCTTIDEGSLSTTPGFW